MGVVYKAIDTSVNRTVALKILSTSLAEDEKYVGRFMREARAAAALNHPNIVGAVDFGVEGKYYYFAMEFVDGENCRKLIKNHGVYPETQAVDITIGVANALQHAWTKKIVHRDIKPDNIMLSSTGEVKVADMGLAKATDSAEATLTQAGHMIGTPQFASPEQIRGQLEIDCRTDIYSLGMTLYYLVVGQPAFDGPTAAVITSLHLEQPFPAPKVSRPDLSDGFCTVLRKMAEKAPENRYQSPEELIQDLQLVRSGQAPVNATAAAAVALETPQVATQVAEHHGISKFLILPLIAILAVGGGAGYLFYKEKQKASANPPPDKGSPEDTDPGTRRANRLLRAAIRHAEQKPTDFPEILRRLDAAKILAQGTTLEPEVVEKIMAWHQKWAAAAQKEFAERKKRADAYAQNSEFEQALAVWADFPGTLSTEAAKGLIERERARLLEQKGATVSAPPIDVEPPSGTGGTTDPDPEPVDPATPETEVTGLPIDAYLNVMEQLEPALKARDLGKIVQTAQELAQGGGNPSLTSFLEQLAKDAPKVGTLVASTVEALKGKIGQEVRISGIPMKVVAVDEEKLIVEVGGAEQVKPFLRTRGKDLLGMQGLTDETAPAEKLYAAGLVHFIDGQYRDAVEYLSKGGEENHAKLYGDMARLAVEAEAMAQIKEIRAALEKNDLSEVQKLVKDVRSSYGQTKVVELHEGFLAKAERRVRDAQNRRKGQIDRLLGIVDKVAKAELDAMETEYDKRKKEMEKAQLGELTASHTITIEEVQGIIHGDGAPVKLKPGDDLPMTGAWKLVTWCEYKISPRLVSKEEQFKHLAKFINNSGMDAETSKVVKTAYAKLKKEIPAIKKKYVTLSSKLKNSYSGKKRSLDTRARRLALKIKDGETPNEAEIRAYLTGK